MPSDRIKRIQAIFEEALNLPREERDAFLAKACAGLDEIRAEVERLLNHDQRAPADFLEPPEGMSPFQHVDIPAPTTLPVGSVVGNYVIQAIIDSGGMGTVYRAEQQNPRRDVALKIMRAGIASASALKRFEYEAQILARLQHPNIAHVYEAGIHDLGPAVGRIPFFAMEYVPGATDILTYAEDEELSLQQRLELFIKVCDGVHHGHQKGVIHRDLKPGNILVNEDGQPKIIDFGVAKSTDSDVAVTTMRTDVGQLIGTLQYMSPEQCEADPTVIDIRSDVYALGIVLFELVCDKLPYEVSDTTLWEAARIIREDAPARPSSINHKLRGDLETIVLKALEKDRERRYQSANELGQDIRRFLQGEPIEARPPTRWTRAARWIGRHPVWTTAAGCAALLLFTVASAWGSVWYIRNRPDKITLTDDKSEAQLHAVSGRVLHQWNASPPGQIKLAELIKRPPEFGNGSIAVIGFYNAYNRRNANSLCAFDVNGNCDEAIWVGSISTADLPDRVRKAGGRASEFHVRLAWCEDVIDASPGKEIIAVHHRGAHSACDIRIYDTKGKTLYEVWHIGALECCYWMKDAGLLVFAGLNAEKSWSGRGFPELKSDYPQVLFALRPEFGKVSKDFVGFESPEDIDSLEWYKCLLPPEAGDFITGAVFLGPPIDGNNPGRFVHYTLMVEEGMGATIGWTIDEFGQIVPGSCLPTDGYKRLKEVPKPSEFRLGLPPRKSPTTHPAAELSKKAAP